MKFLVALMCLLGTALSAPVSLSAVRWSSLINRDKMIKLSFSWLLLSLFQALGSESEEENVRSASVACCPLFCDECHNICIFNCRLVLLRIPVFFLTGCCTGKSGHEVDASVQALPATGLLHHHHLLHHHLFICWHFNSSENSFRRHCKTPLFPLLPELR